MNSLTPFWTVTLFWAAAAVCVIIALAFVLPPLLRKKVGTSKALRRDINIAVYRDQMKELEADRANGLLLDAQYQTSKIELEGRLAEDALAQDAQTEAPRQTGGRVLGFSLAGLLPVAAFGLYFVMGNPAALTAVAEAQANPGMGADAQGGHDIMQLIKQVEEKTQADPNNGEAWAILAKTYAAVEHWPEALTAYEKALALLPETPSIMTGYAEALAIKNNRVLQGKPIQLVLQALEKDPDDIKGLELAAIAAFQDKGYAKASYYFKRLLKLVPPESPYAQDIEAAQKEASRLAMGGMTGMDNLSDQDTSSPQAAAPGATIQGHLDIAPALKAKVGKDDVLFLFARSPNGGPPVAAIRANAVKFPMEFELSDAMAMNPEIKLSNFKEVTLMARLAKTGDIKGAAGDLEGTLGKVKVGSKGLKLVIDSERK